jgi:epoxyqueuosine reductase
MGGCGDCTACIDACPAKALVAPYRLDARKCISYKFFIEKREGGCDMCQDVCPYNKEKI